MVTHYTLQTKDHKFVTKEIDLTPMEMEFVKFGMKNYYQTLEKNYERLIVEEQLPEMAKALKEALENVRQIRRKLDGRE